MKNILLRGLSVCLLSICMLACSSRKSEPITGKTVATSDAQVKQGEKVFMMYCYKCHPGGEAGLGPSVFHKPGFARKFQVRHGLGVMPGFKADKISKEDLKAIEAYLKAREKL